MKFEKALKYLFSLKEYIFYHLKSALFVNKYSFIHLKHICLLFTAYDSLRISKLNRDKLRLYNLSCENGHMTGQFAAKFYQSTLYFRISDMDRQNSKYFTFWLLFIEKDYTRQLKIFSKLSIHLIVFIRKNIS